MNYYISDMHFGHENIIKIDSRPFENKQQMEEKLVSNWNERVTSKDTVYILGDFIISKDEKEWHRILNRLNGKKVLVKGNHDLQTMSNKLKMRFEDVQDWVRVIKDRDRTLVLCHYPMPCFPHSYHGWHHLYGHLHKTKENSIITLTKDIIKKKQITIATCITWGAC